MHRSGAGGADRGVYDVPLRGRGGGGGAGGAGGGGRLNVSLYGSTQLPALSKPDM